MMQVNSETEMVGVGRPADGDNQKWTYKPSCEGGVVMTNLATDTTNVWTYNAKDKTIWNGSGFAMSTKRKGLQWNPNLQYQAGTKKPWQRYQWEITRV